MSIIRRDIGPKPPSRLKTKLSVVRAGRTVADLRLELRTGGEFSVYSRAPEEFETAMERLATDAIEANIFHTAAFTHTALNQEGSGLRLALIGTPQAGGDLLLDAALPFRIEQQAGTGVICAWAEPDIAYAAPLIARRNPMATLDQLFDALGGQLVNLPPVLVFEGLVADGPFMRYARAAAAARGLFFRVAASRRAKILTPAGLTSPSPSAEERRRWTAMLEKWTALSGPDGLAFEMARNPREIEAQIEMLAPLLDESGGAADIVGLGAVARRLSARDHLRLYTLKHHGALVAAVLQPVLAGEAWVWQIYVHPEFSVFALDEQLLLRLGEWNPTDPNITTTRISVSNNDRLASSIWPEEEGRATLIVGLRPESERAVDAVAAFHDTVRA
ncbi:GNAT family N-acetyltransferase [Martelella sp. HB161492]|uniref:GNAT family N-acetyltransferase n=1 Tax=Martelella sp. HB161492 TaxID=2720726 RepID=UPI0015906BCB|nr:GNAT family N-acetyltransferase [Martelella sp. HB161492]